MNFVKGPEAPAYPRNVRNANDEFCIQNEEFGIENEEFCIENDECRRLLHDFLVLHGAYRPAAMNVFPKNEAGEAVVATLAKAVMMDIGFIISPGE